MAEIKYSSDKLGRDNNKKETQFKLILSERKSFVQKVKIYLINLIQSIKKIYRSFLISIKSLISSKKGKIGVAISLLIGLIIIFIVFFLIFFFSIRFKNEEKNNILNSSIDRQYDDIINKSKDENDNIDTEKLADETAAQIDNLIKDSKNKEAFLLALNLIEDLNRDKAYSKTEEVLNKINYISLENESDKIRYCKEMIDVQYRRNNMESAKEWENILIKIKENSKMPENYNQPREWNK